MPELTHITGNLAMPGFTAPKLEWIRTYEAENFVRVAKVLLPKDYVRLLMTGDYASDMSDSAGTLWIDEERRDWSDEVLALTALTSEHMPKLYEGSDATGTSSDAEDLFHGHIGGMDLLARALINVAAMIEDDKVQAFKDNRHAGWSKGMGKQMMDCNAMLNDMANYCLEESVSPDPVSDRQEYLENIVTYAVT